MFPVVASLPNFPGVNFPNVCTEEPAGNSAFCAYHLRLAKDRGYPTDVRGFLSYCGVTGKSINHIQWLGRASNNDSTVTNHNTGRGVLK